MAQQRQHIHLDSDELMFCIGLLEGGCTQRYVANYLNVSQSVVSRAWTRYQAFGTPTRRHAGGRQWATTQREDSFLILQARRNRFQRAPFLRSQLINATGTRISAQTVRNRLHMVNLHSRRPCVRIPLTRAHCRRRFQWAQGHVNWTINDWTPVLFTDESRFCVEYTDGRARVWRLPGERYQDACIYRRDRYGGGSVMVWAGISMGGKTDLYILRQGALNGMRYRDEILDVYVRPYAGAVGDGFVLMDDNAPPHRARVVDDYLEQETIERMEWPAQSPDLNPIEHCWDMLQVAIGNRQHQPTTVQELENALFQEWNNIGQNQVQRLITSMRRQCRAVVIARGSNTSY